MFYKNIFSECLLNLRKGKGISQNLLANEIGVSLHQISKMETGQRGPSIEVACALADYFDVSIDYLVGRSSCQMTLDRIGECQDEE